VAATGDGIAVAIGGVAAQAALVDERDEAPALPGAPGPRPALGAVAPLAADPVFARAQSMARDNPRAAALVLKKWMTGNEP
jgi:hypothetical protein